VVEAAEALRYNFVPILCVENLRGKIKTLQFKYFWINYYNWHSDSIHSIFRLLMNIIGDVNLDFKVS